MGNYSKNYNIAVKNNPCFINHKIENEYVLPLDGFFELIILYLLKKNNFSFPISFADIHIKKLLAAKDLQSEKCINLSHNSITNEIVIKDVTSADVSILSGSISSYSTYKNILIPTSFPNRLSFQEIYTNEDSEIQPFYHSIKEILYDDHYALATIESCLKNSDLALFYNDVTVLNGVFIALINVCMAVNKSSQLYLPYFIRKLSFLKKIEQGSYELQIERGCDNSYSLRLYDRHNDLILAADGVELNPLQSSDNIVVETFGEIETTNIELIQEPIAIIGMSGRFPTSKNIDEFWKNLCSSYDGISSIPAHRRQDFIDKSKNKLEKGGFLDDIASFDASFFDISGYEAVAMEPQQRLFLECAWEALEQAGYANNSQLNCGVYLGITQGDYLSINTDAQLAIPQSFWGNAPSIAASRISYYLDLTGPAVAIDTACSSSLTALHLACEQLRHGDLELAIAGGVFVTVTDQFHQKASRANMLSPDHQCYAFSEKANGFVPGEAVAAVVLKRLSQAEKDGDYIHAVIVGSGINQDGRTNGIIAPNSKSQSALQKSVYEKFKINPRQIGYIEAHGTGTKLGDPIELDGLQETFSTFTQQKQFCAIGSVKSNMGHAAAAAGMASLIKVCLSLRYQTIPASRHTQVTNHDIDFKSTAFYPAQKTTRWSGTGPRMAAINSFGFSGTNAHVVVKEYISRKDVVQKNCYFFPFTAKNHEDLFGYMKEFSAWLVEHNEFDLSTISYTLSCRKKHFDSRLIIIATHREEFVDTINSLVSLGVNKLKSFEVYYGSSISRQKHEYQDLLTHFIERKPVSWMDYFNPNQRHTAPLPTYHWKKTEYWPHATIPSTSHIDLNPNLAYIKDHIVKGIPLLPAAAYIAFCYSKLDKKYALANIYFLSPLIVENEERLLLDIDYRQKTFMFKMNNKMYCHGDINEVNELHRQEIIPKKNFKDSIGKNEIYERLFNQALFYGARLNKLESIDYDNTELLAHAKLNSEDDLITILDVSLQATVVFNVEHKQYLPFYIRELIIHDIPQNDIYIVAKKIADNELSMSFEIVVLDANQHVCIDINGVEVRTSLKSEVLPPKLYFRDMKEIDSISFEQSNLSVQNIIRGLLCSAHKDGAEVDYESNFLLLDAFNDQPNILKINLEEHDYHFIEKNEVQSLENASIYFVCTSMFEPDDLTPVKWIYNFLYRLLSTKLSKVRLTFVFDATNAVQISAIEGLMHSIHLETEKVRIQLIQFDSKDSIDTVFKNALLTESNDFIHIGKSLSIPQYRELDSIKHQPILRSKGVYIICGGAGGVGKELIEYLSLQYQATIIVLTRNMKPNLSENIYQYQCDITNRDILRRVIEEIQHEFPVINGVFHLAGVLDDKLFVNTTWDSFYQVIAPKLLGVVYLNELTKNIELDFFCCFSSLSACIGNPGQSAYSYANSFLDHYMKYRADNKYFGCSQSIMWPLWKVGGMGSNPTVQTSAMKRWKLPAIDSQLAFSLLEKCLNSRRSNVLIANDYILSNSQLPHAIPTPPSVKPDLVRFFSESLKIPAEEIHLDKPFLEYGIDSLLAVGIIEKLSLYDGELPKSLLFELTNLAELAEYLAKKRQGVVIPASLQAERGNDGSLFSNTQEYPDDCIAIIGMAGKYPEADNLGDFWNNLRQSKLSITALAERKEHSWPYAWAGLINRYDYFDPLFFGISPLDAIKMDPQERQFLQVAYHAFEHAGYPKQRLKNEPRVGVYVGVMYGLYQLNALKQTEQSGQPPVIANSTYASIANRVSYCLDLQGPSMAVDTMCSSSLTTIHLGIQSLLSQETNMVLCGGVNLITHPYKYAELLQKSFLATDGLCHSFAERGDGYVPGEGVGAVVLKRMTDAVRDNDRILAVIRASAVNHGGFSSGYTVPRKIAQRKLLSEALAMSGLKAADIQYIEAHGTGTELGDPIEFRALDEVYGQDSTEKIYLGSLKANIGHLESAAGIASLTKVLLQMHHQEISPHLLHGGINPNLTVPDACFEFAKAPIPWQSATKNAVISSFGAGGSNAHLIVSHYTPLENNNKAVSTPLLLCVSANTKEGVRQKWRQLHAWFTGRLNIDLVDLSFTLAVARDHFQYKSILLCNNVEELRSNVEDVLNGVYPFIYFDDQHREHLHQQQRDIQEKIIAYLDQKIPNFDGWFPYKNLTILDLPLYPYDELRYNIMVEEVKPAVATLKKQRWINSGRSLSDGTKLIEQCLVIVHGEIPLIAENFNLSGCFLLDLSKRNYIKDIESGIAWLRGTGHHNIVDLVGISPFEKEVFEQHFEVYLHFLKNIGNEPLEFYCCYSTGYCDEFSEFSAQLNALFYVISAEHNWINCCCIEVDGFTPLKNILNFEQNSAVKSPNIKYLEGFRYIRELYTPDPHPANLKQMNPNAYYLVTGGSSGIGYLMAKHLVRLGAKKLILMGITPIPDESLWHQSTGLSKKQQLIVQNLTALRHEGVEVKHISCSLHNEQDLLELLQPMINNIVGIIHAAGLTDLKLERLQNKTLTEFQKHIDVKYCGLKNIISLIPSEHLDYVIAFSSMSSSYPKEARGISSYAFANHFMDNYIEFLSLSHPDKFLSIRWPLWRESIAGHTGRTDLLETNEALSIFDTTLTCYRDGVVNVELEPIVVPDAAPRERIANRELTSNNSILQWLINYFVTQMKVPSQRIDIDKSFLEYGIDSILLLGLINALESHLGQSVAPTIVLENPTLRMLASYFSDVDVVNGSSHSDGGVKPNDHGDEELIAIIGVAGRFPGAEHLNQFWDNLIRGRCDIKSVPNDRLGEISDFEKAGFIANLKWFDPSYFGLSEEYARQLDPLMRLSLELSAESILNAGYTLDEFKGRRCGVLVAARAANYVNYLESFSKDTISGIGQNFLAAQVSQYFNLTGPSYVVDSACSSSLTAIYLACQHLKSKDIDYALVSGVELLLDNRPFELLRAGGALSSTQRCQPFSEHADGITLGEGGGAIILKRLKDAILDGDKIEAIIMGGAINNDGQTMGMTTPNPQSQRDVVKLALNNAKLEPESISYIEAHATGTAIGDPIELAALTNVFSNNHRASCAVGSVKSNIGHLLSAAGMASILKIILAMKHHQLPKSLGSNFPNKRFKFEESPFYLLNDNVTWTSDKTRYAGVSGFGFGGTNVHLILSDFIPMNHYVQKRFELSSPQYNKKYIWPKSAACRQENDETMSLFFEINAT